MDLRVLDDAAGAAAEAAGWTAHHLRGAVRRRGSASIAVSGGTTPASMFAELATMDLPWDRITVFQVDERVAPDGDAARNARLLELFPAAARLEPMPVTDRDLSDGAARYGRALPGRFDIVHLGIGDDGHTASWPPGDPVVDAAEPVALSRESRGDVRMTLTPPVVNAARYRLVLAAGADKAAPLEGWLLGNDSLPIHRVRGSDTVVVVDRAAAARLPGMGR